MRVYGKADGVDVTFYHVEGDILKTDVPWKEDGKYIAEIYTEDDAGNVSYLCDMLFVISGHELKTEVIPVGEKPEDTGQKYHVQLQNTEQKYHVQLREGGYSIDNIRCGFTVRSSGREISEGSSQTGM